MADNQFIVFDVIGTKFRLKKQLFENYRSSRFYSLMYPETVDKLNLPQCITKTEEDDEFYIQRSPDMFKLVILYCINKKLHVPSCTCSDEVMDEFHFWRIHFENVCENCSNHHYTASKNNSPEVEDDEKDYNNEDKTCRFRPSLWRLMQDPHSSCPALVLFFLSMLVILMSILNIILSSVPQLQNCPSNITKSNVEDNRKAALDAMDDFKPTDCSGTMAFNIVDMFCMTWFSLELILRLISCPNFKKFFKSPMTFVDIFSIVPFYFEILMWAIQVETDEFDKARAILMFLRLFKLFQIMRILKLARYSMNLKVLGKTILSAQEGLWMLLMFLFIASLIFSNCVYQFEKDQIDTEFTSIPATFWWCIVTLTTVGYGDMYPQTVGGKIIAGVTCVCGILLIAFPIAVLVDKFQTTYNEEKKKEKAKHHSKKLFSMFHSFSNSHEKVCIKL